MRLPWSFGLTALAGACLIWVLRTRHTRLEATLPLPMRAGSSAVAVATSSPPDVAALVAPVQDRPAPATDARADAPFRPDVEGLRGIAILLVLLFHGAFPVPGGFVGVDVFFVISGFLITGMLVREVDRTGSIALDRFYARRMRRLLPAAAVVMAVTLPLSYVVLAPLDRATVMDDGIASMLSAANLRFALADGEYFAAVSGPSPFLHFWSLALEEQFYLLWPVLLLLVARGRRPAVPAAVALAGLFIVSFVGGVLLTDISAPWAFYSLPGRAWQFAAGGLLAVGAGVLGRVPTVPLVVAGWSGAALLAASALLLDGSLPYPGILAAAPTAAAVLLIASGDRPYGPRRLLSSAPLRSLGRISYSLYLWHWPVLVLPAFALDSTLTPTAAIALTAVAVVVAWMSERWIERRFRRPLPRERRAIRRSLAFGASTAAAVVVFGSSLGLAAEGAIAGASDAGAAAIARDAPVAADDAAPVIADGRDASAVESEPTPPPTFLPTAAPTPSGSPPGSESASAAASPIPTPGAPASLRPKDWSLSIPDRAVKGKVPLPRDVRPTLAAVRGDVERLFADGCIANTYATRPPRCVYGHAKGSPTVALVGDSHASHWFPAFNVLAKRHGWRLLPYVKVSCPFVDMPVKNLVIKRTYTECATWRERVIDRVNRERPDLVVVISGYRAIIATRSADASPKRQGAAMARAIARLKAPVAIMIDSPRASFDIPSCLSRHRDDVRACAIPRGQAFPNQYGLRERLAAEATGAGLLDLVAPVCPATPCQVVRDGHILYRDGHHLTATFVRSLAGELDAALAPYLAPPPPPPSPAATPPPNAPDPR